MKNLTESIGIPILEEFVELQAQAKGVESSKGNKHGTEGVASANGDELLNAHRAQGVEAMKDQLRSLRPVSRNRCIYRVPHYIFRVNEEAYRPWVVSIGPYYAQDPRLQATQKQKLRHLHKFLQRSNTYRLENYMSYVREKEEEAREYYDEEVLLTSNDFVNMLLLDAAFIIEFLLWFAGESYVAEQMMEVVLQAGRDLLLEENQLPFFILEGLYDLAFPIGMDSRSLSFMDLCCNFIIGHFNIQKITSTASAREKILKWSSKVKHLVDLLGIYFLPSFPWEGRPQKEWKFPKSASELSSAGVKFAAVPGSTNLLNITFVKGMLKIPKFMIQDSTESTYRSIMLLEQCHCNHFFSSYFTDYMFFLASLINTSKDVQILVENGILDNWLGNAEEVADLFNKITTNLTLYGPKFYYTDISGDLNKYADKSWHRWKAILKTDYFSHPWSTISTFYLVVLLILTVLQVYTGFRSIYNN